MIKRFALLMMLMPGIAQAFPREGMASYYAYHWAGRHTASGAIFNPLGMTCASKTLPLDSWVRVTDLSTDRSVVLYVDDRGPYVGDRIMDVSLGAARRLGMVQSGLARVRITPLRLDRDYSYKLDHRVPHWTTRTSRTHRHFRHFPVRHMHHRNLQVSHRHVLESGGY